MTTSRTGGPRSRGRRSDKPRGAAPPLPDAATTEARAAAAKRLANAEVRLRDAREKGEPKAIGAALRARDRAARTLVGDALDVPAAKRAAALLDIERKAIAKLGPEGVARVREVVAHALAVIAHEGVTSPLDLLAMSVGARVLGMGVALIEEHGAGELRAATYAADRGMRLIVDAIERTRADRAAAQEQERQRAATGWVATPVNQNVLCDRPADAPEGSQIILLDEKRSDSASSDDDEPAPEPARVADAPRVQAPPETPAASNVVPPQAPPAGTALRSVDRATGVIVDTRTQRQRLEDERAITERGLKPKPLIWDAGSGGWRARTEADR